MNKPLNFAATKQVKDAIRHPFAWPGGYDLYAITTDGGCLCTYCLKSEFRNVIHSTLTRCSDGWEVADIAATCNTDSEVRCDHCNTIIQEDWQQDSNS